jgi:hypothetical protein
VETGCRGGQGAPRAVAPRRTKKKKKKKIITKEESEDYASKDGIILWNYFTLD